MGTAGLCWWGSESVDSRVAGRYFERYLIPIGKEKQTKKGTPKEVEHLMTMEMMTEDMWSNIFSVSFINDALQCNVMTST